MVKLVISQSSDRNGHAAGEEMVGGWGGGAVGGRLKRPSANCACEVLSDRIAKMEAPPGDKCLHYWRLQPVRDVFKSTLYGSIDIIETTKLSACCPSPLLPVGFKLMESHRLS